MCNRPVLYVTQKFSPFLQRTEVDHWMKDLILFEKSMQLTKLGPYCEWTLHI